MADNDKVMIMDAEYTEDSMNAVVEHILENVPMDFSGKAVLIKPNMAAQCRVDKAATTHPTLIKAVVKAVERRNAKTIIVGDNPGATAYGINEKCAKTTGIMDASCDYYVNFMKRPKNVELESKHLDYVNLSSEFFECDYFINLPKLKAHTHALMTGAVKNLYGMCVGGEKSRLHATGHDSRSFAEILCDVYATRVPDLHITDGVVGMEGNGPTNGSPRDVGKVLASMHGYNLDAVSSKVIGFSPDRVNTLAVGKDRGLWSGDLNTVQVEGDYPNIPKFKPPSTFGAYTIFNRIMSPFISCLPVIQEKKCIKCGLCASQCPVDACTWEKGQYPVIDKKGCIKCYCCQEFCPGDAIALNGKMLKLTNMLAGTTRKI